MIDARVGVPVIDPRPPTLGAVLCGGASSRMGRDKALLGPPQRPLVAHVAEALHDAGADEVVLVGGDGPALRRFGDDWFDDDAPGSGPLGGICTVSRRRPDAIILVCACDLPDIAGRDLLPLLDAIAAGADVAVFDVDGVPQWSAVAVSPGASTSIVGSFDAGERSLHGGLGPPGLHVVRLRPERPAALRDVDRPEDLPVVLR